MIPMRELVTHSIGGGWGDEVESSGSERVAIIRGADFPAVAKGDVSTVPLRWESARKLPKRLLRPGDIVLEGSGGTSDRPTGRTVFISQALLEQFDAPVIPASFCRLVRVDQEKADPYFVYWWLQNMHTEGRTWGYQNRSTGIANFQFQHFLDAETVLLPSREQQRGIAATLGALDDKIESNRRQRAILRELGLCEYQNAVSGERRFVQLAKVTVSIARGVAPKYADDDPEAPQVINQKCIRDGWVSLEQSRRMMDRVVKIEKRAVSGDLLVNSTGTGTLGRVARWHKGDIFVDSHVSVVRPDPDAVPPTVLAYSILGREADIEDLATGSTGQTELSPSRLAELSVELPVAGDLSRIEELLLTIENRCDQLAEETQRLVALRGSLLPELLSGRIRAADVEVPS